MTAVVFIEYCLSLPSSCTLSLKKPVLMEGKSWNILEDNMHFHSDLVSLSGFQLQACGGCDT